jgi:hypothetical protein
MLRRIADLRLPCQHPEHVVSEVQRQQLPPGVYENVCPACGYRIWFTIGHPYCDTQPTPSRAALSPPMVCSDCGYSEPGPNHICGASGGTP